MGDIFLKLLNMSITAGWLIVAVLCIRLIFRKIPKWVNCFLWGAVAIRLLCPFSFESQLCILPGTEPVKSSTVVEGEVQEFIPSIESHITIVDNTINPALTKAFAYNESDSAAPLQIITHIAGVVWVCGMVLLIICAAGSMIKLHKLVREAVCLRDNIYICDDVKSPFILGILRPRVYLSSSLGEKEMDYILAHESAHLKRKDHWWKMLGYLLLCIYWFHPLCWAAYAMFCKDIELACDEKLAKNMTLCEKKEYSEVLLSCTRQRRMVMVCPLAFGEVGVKERVKSILNYKKPALWILVAAVALCMILAVCFLTNPTKEYQVKITNPAENMEIFASLDSAEEENLRKKVIVKAEEVKEGTVSVQDILLYKESQADKVCIEVQPPIVSEQLSYYYIPTGEEQKWLLNRMESLDLKMQSSGETMPSELAGQRETGWQIVYDGMWFMVFEGGYLYYSDYDDEKGMTECVIEDPKLCDYIQVMLIDKIGYRRYDVSKIKDIVSAKLDVKSIFTDWKFYSQTITDKEILNKFEEWFCNAEYIFGGADCGNQCACLELTLADGEVVKLSMATDSCPNFSINGIAYDYRPEQIRDNIHFYKYFNEIPYDKGKGLLLDHSNNGAI